MISKWFPPFPPFTGAKAVKGGASQNAKPGPSASLYQGGFLVVVGLALALAGLTVCDVWNDYMVEGLPLWLTLTESVPPFLLALGLPLTTWLLSQTGKAAFLGEAAKWACAGALAAVLLATIAGGVQALQGELKTLDLLILAVTFGVASGFLIGLTLASLRRAWGQAERERRHLQSLKESVLEGIVIAGEGGRIIDWNRGASEIFGYDEEEIIGRPITALMPRRHKRTLLRGLERMDPAGEGQMDPKEEGGHLGETIELDGQRKSGEEFPAEVSLSSWTVGSNREEGKERYYAAIVRDITDRRALQREVLQVQEEERRSIGQKLHDGVASQLTGVGMMLGTAAQRAGEESLAERLQKVRELVVESCDQVRELSRGLNPTGMSKGDLPAALRRLEKNTDGCTFEAQGFEAEGDREEGSLPTPEDLPELEEDAATHLYYIAQEALANAQKYAEADEIAIRLHREEGTLALEVTDDGEGFDVGAVEKENSLGLRSMRHRAEVLGAELKVESSPGEGTCVRCRVPV